MNKSFRKRAIFKFNSGIGAILCSLCSTIIKTGHDFTHEERLAMKGEFELPEQFCTNCQKKQKKHQ